MVSLNMIYFVLFPQASEPNIISLWSVLFWKNDFCRNKKSMLKLGNLSSKFQLYTVFIRLTALGAY